MTEEKLFELLTLIKEVRSRSWTTVGKIVELMPSIEVKEKKWSQKYKQDNPELFPLDLSKIETWSTYDRDCISLIFRNENNRLVCDVNIYDGDNVNGYRTSLRFTATLIMPSSFIKEIEQEILYALDILAEDSYEDYLETQKKLWIENFKLKFL